MEARSDNVVPDPGSVGRFWRCVRLTDEMLRGMSAAQRDRMMQTHLAAARGPVKNFQVHCALASAMRALGRGVLGEERGDHG